MMRRMRRPKALTAGCAQRPKARRSACRFPSLTTQGESRWRGEAFELASSTLARMWVEDAATLATRYDALSDGVAYRALLAAALRLPGVSTDENTPVVTITDEALGRRRARVTVYWRLPGDSRVHAASAFAILPGS